MVKAAKTDLCTQDIQAFRKKDPDFFNKVDAVGGVAAYAVDKDGVLSVWVS